MSAHRRWLVVPLLLGFAACADRPTAPPARVRPAHAPDAGRDFDPSATGTITGVVRWGGSIPAAQPFRSIDEPLTDQPLSPAHDRTNPNAPRIDAGSRALAGAVVLLRGVDPRKARPWDHPPARIDLRGQTFRVAQGGESNVGFVRTGGSVEFTSRDDRLHVAQARGSAFFSLALPRPDRPRSRRLDSPGLVEVRSGTGYFWMRAYLHVSDHPYLARTDDAGRFRLEDVPPGEYDLVAWHPDWRVAGETRNPDLFRVQQIDFRRPLESVRRVRVGARRATESDLTLGPSPIASR